MKVLKSLTAIIIIATLVVGMSSVYAHCDTVLPRPSSDNNVARFNENPYTYLYGEVLGGQVYKDDHLYYTQIEFQPAGTLLLEPVVFCGDQTNLFTGQTKPVVMTYTRKSSTKYKNTSCHTLLSVDRVQQ